MTARRNPWLPSFGMLLWLVFILGLTLSHWRLVMINADGDSCLHRSIGRWIIEHHTVMRADVFSHTRPGAPVVTMEWLTELAFAALGNALDWNGIVLFAAMMIATSLWILHRQMLLETSDVLLATALALLAGAACSMHWLARPHVVSLVLVAFFGWQLRAFEQGNPSMGQLLLRLVPLMMLWVNMHGAFPTGLILVGIYWSGSGIEVFAHNGEAQAAAWRKMRSLAVVGTACMIASFVNPNGWGLYRYLGGFFQHTKLVGFTNEFRSPNFHSHGTYGFVLLLATLAIVLVGTRARFSATEILLVGWAGCFALRWVRNVPIFAMVVTPILARHLSVWLHQAPDWWLVRRYRKISRDATELNCRADGRWLAAIVLAALVFAMTKPRVVGGPPLSDTGLLTNRFPVAAIGFLRENPTAVSGEMFNDYGWGGYLIWAMPEHTVFMDGRNDFYGNKIIEDFSDVNLVHPEWDAVLHRYKVGWTILPRDHPLNTLLALRPDWSLAYADDVAAIYTRYPKRAAVSE